MFIRSVRLQKPRLLLAGISAVIIALIAWAVIAAADRSREDRVLRTETDRQQFIREMGWETSEKYTECRSVTIPEDWSEVYEQYNELQLRQGFDLSGWKGKTVEIYTYPVYNYEGHTDKDCMQLTLMICDNVLIGGDVCCTELDGFMQGLKKAD